MSYQSRTTTMLREDHFLLAINDIVKNGDNDTLPIDADIAFLRESREKLIKMALKFSASLEREDKRYALNIFNQIPFFSERLLTPAGPTGFRVTTKIHPFWNFYFNALGIAIAERHEPLRSDRAHSYRYIGKGDLIFDPEWSWRKFREKTLEDCQGLPETAVVVQTDISSFYEHIYHHRIENFIDELFPDAPTISVQVDRMLNSFAAGRSFGLPVGGQCARILAELLMSKIDGRLNANGVKWRRYVDDFVLIAKDQNEAYRILAILSHALADYGLSLSKTKTSFLKVKHYLDYAKSQLGGEDEQSKKLMEIDLRFDPYSDSRHEDWEQLKGAVKQLNIMKLLEDELGKTQPDNFVVTQISRTLKLLEPKVAIDICRSLLQSTNLHAFRSSFSKIMRGISALRSDPEHHEIHNTIDILADAIPTHSAHLLTIDTNCLHYLKLIRFTKTEPRARYVSAVYDSAKSETIKRACIECWRAWRDRDQFISLRSKWNAMGREEQRMLWLAAGDFTNDGHYMRKQVIGMTTHLWSLGANVDFANAYIQWAGGK